MKDKLIVNGTKYLVNIYFENRRRTRASIGRTGVHIRIPFCLPREERLKRIIEMKQWAKQKLQEKPINFKKKGWKEYNDKEVIKLGNKKFLLRLTYSNNRCCSAKIRGNIIFLNIPGYISDDLKRKNISIILSRVAAKLHRPFITQKIYELNKKHFNFPINRIFLKYNQSNWGSCSNRSNINISTRLLFAPEGVIDYVCIHELAHLKEKNHSAAFWSLVESAMPDYKKKQKWLKENSDSCWF